ncbi:hypothetical protein CP8484711_2293B, partial [Chlamydia psittaci 84-8471/1]
YSWCW